MPRGETQAIKSHHKSDRQAQPYLNFGGRFDVALAFYGKVLSAQVTFMMRYNEGRGDQPISEEWKERVMHANIQIIGENQIMASDGMQGQTPAFSGFRCRSAR
ncbi:hypothetical protein [Cupriavidus necator]|uniref:hypothetical protein n=1 Tax=Cupriavidus necator TaxID=106590 RepID=UPI00068A6E03|nr:hypothetical protein [Cupriavidus necator]